MKIDEFSRWVRERQEDVERALERWVSDQAPAGLGTAMRYAVLDGGKRLRPLLVLAASDAVSGDRVSASQLLRQPEIRLAELVAQERLPGFELEPKDAPVDLASAETTVKYAGYLRRQESEIIRARKDERRGIPRDFPFDNVFVTSLAGHEIGRIEMPSIAETKPFDQSPEAFAHCPQFVFDPILARAISLRGLPPCGQRPGRSPSITQRPTKVAWRH